MAHLMDVSESMMLCCGDSAVIVLIVRRVGAPLYGIERLHFEICSLHQRAANTWLCTGDTDGTHVFTGIHRVVTNHLL